MKFNEKYLTMVLAMVIIFQFVGLPARADRPVVIDNVRISMGYDGSQANGNSLNPNISDNGRYVVFFSDATNLVPNDTNGKIDVFVFDLETQIMERVSTASSGEQANDDDPKAGMLADISDDGRFVVFESFASNLVKNDTNNFCEDWDTHEIISCPDVFVKDRLTNETRLVSVSSAGEQANFGAILPSISADGRYVTFTSNATNLVEHDANNVTDIFWRDLQTGETRLVSEASDGSQADGGSFLSSISGDGRFVSFESQANNLTVDNIDVDSDIFVRDLQNDATTLISGVSAVIKNNHQTGFVSFISGNGRYVVFSLINCGEFTCIVENMYCYDRQTAETSMVSLALDGTAGNDYSSFGNVSDDGSAAFVSEATNLVEAGVKPCKYCRNVFFRHGDKTVLVSKNMAGQYSNGISDWGLIAAGNSSRVVFNSTSSDLVPGDTNGYGDIFVYGWKSTPVYFLHLPLVIK